LLNQNITNASKVSGEVRKYFSGIVNEHKANDGFYDLIDIYLKKDGGNGTLNK